MNKRGVLLMVVFFAGMIAGCGGEKDDVVYLIRRVGADMKVDGDVNKPAWRLAKPIHIEQNPFLTNFSRMVLSDQSFKDLGNAN